MPPWKSLAVALLFLLAPALASAQATVEEAPRAGSRGPMSTLNTVESYLDWQAYSAYGWRAMDKGYYDTAEHEFKGAIRIAGRPSLNNRLLMAWSYSDLAWALYYQGRQADAEPLARWALAVREAKLGPQSPIVAQSLYGLAAIQSSLGQPAEAEASLRRALAIHDGVEHPDLAETGRVLASLGQLLAKQRRYAEAEVLFTRAVPIREAAQGASAPETTESVADLASTLFEQGKEDEALPMFRRVLAALEQSRGRTDASLATPLLAIADIQGRRGEAEAEADYRRALALLNTADPVGNRATANALRRYAAWLDRAGRENEAKPLRTRSDAIQKRLAAAPAPAPTSSPSASQGRP